jgi:hypothetical protein
MIKVEYDKRAYDDSEARKRIVTVYCTCGQKNLSINFIPAPYTGSYTKVTCPSCKSEKVLMDDYS